MPASSGHVAAHVGAVGVEAPGLRRRVEDAVRARVDARAGDPLPVAGVVRDVAIDEQRGEVRRPEPPVDVQILRQERRREQPRAVVHEALARELPHPRVDDRVARAALLPGREALGVVRASGGRAAGSRVVDDLGARGEQLRVEVAPAELPHERLGALAAAGALAQLERREAAEMEERAEPRGAVGGEVVVQLVVGRQRPRASQRVKRFRPSDSPPRAALGRRPWPLARAASAGSLPRASRAGTAIARGVAASARRGARCQRRQYGVNTR